MRVLLDTHVFLLWVNGSPGLSATAMRLLRDPRNELLFSLASSWEIAIKASIGKLRLPHSVSTFLLAHLQENNITQLDIRFPHAAKVAELPFHHRDPFDRLLAAQALTERLPILSKDRVFSKYGLRRIW